MNWKPTSAQLELIVDMSTARLSTAAMATALGLCEAELIGWRMACLKATRAEEESYANPEPLLKPVAVPVSPRIVADRAFVV